MTWNRDWLRWTWTRLAADLGRARLALAWLILLTAIAVIGLLAPADLIGDVHPQQTWLGPGPTHPLGTDQLGRDVLTRLLAAPAAFGPPLLLAVGLGLLGGAALASLQATGSWRRQLAELLSTSLSAAPALVIGVLTASITGAGLPAAAIGWGLASAPSAAEPIAARLRPLYSSGLMANLRRHGLSGPRLLLVHGLGAAAHRALLAQALDLAAGFLVTEATLSYLGGFGVSEPQASWGNMMAGTWGHFDAGVLPWAAPLVMLGLTLLALHRVADALHAT